MSEIVNPYASPASLNPTLETGSNAYHVHGKLIGVGPMADFPDTCFITGEPAHDGKRYNKKLYYCNSFWALLILLGIIGIIVYAIIYYSTRKSAMVSFSLSKQQHKKQKRKCIIGVIINTLILGGSIFCLVGSNLNHDFITIGFIGLIVFLISIIITKSICTITRIKNYTNGFSYLTGSGKPFRDYIEGKQTASN